LGTPIVKKIRDFVLIETKKIEPIKLDYFELIDEISLQPVESLDESKHVVACVAFYIGEVRLIDMVRFK
jgi:pantoate--beta-alanine ligase